MKKLILPFYFFFFLTFYSCSLLIFTPAEYTLLEKTTSKIHLPKDKKYLLLINNIPTNDSKFKKNIEDDFYGLFGDNISRKFKNDYFNNFRFLNPIDDELIKNINKDTNQDYVIFIRFMTTNKDINRNSIVRVEDYKNLNMYREYHVLIDIIDLKNGQQKYSNESVSVLERPEDSGWTPTEISQLKQTYKKVFKN